jgi:hypothetical protein
MEVEAGFEHFIRRSDSVPGVVNIQYLWSSNICAILWRSRRNCMSPALLRDYTLLNRR